MKKVWIVWCRWGFQGSDGWADMSRIIGVVVRPEDAGEFAREYYTRELKERESSRPLTEPLSEEERSYFRKEIEIFSSFSCEGGVWYTAVSGRARLRLDEVDVWTPPSPS